VSHNLHELEVADSTTLKIRNRYAPRKNSAENGVHVLQSAEYFTATHTLHYNKLHQTNHVYSCSID